MSESAAGFRTIVESAADEPSINSLGVELRPGWRHPIAQTAGHLKFRRSSRKRVFLKKMRVAAARSGTVKKGDGYF